MKRGAPRACSGKPRKKKIQKKGVSPGGGLLRRWLTGEAGRDTEHASGSARRDERQQREVVPLPDDAGGIG